MNCNTTHYRANSSSVPGDPTFSFILAALGKSLGILPPEGMDVLVVAAIVSIALNPLLFRIEAAFEARRADALEEAKAAESAVTHKSRAAVPPVVITGPGALTQRLVRRCVNSAIPVCIVDNDADALEPLREPGVTVVAGDPAQPDVQQAAGLREAKMIVVTTPSLPEKMRICIAARGVNPRIAIVATAASDAERVWLEEFGAAFVCDALDEMADQLLRSIRSGL